MRRAVLFAVVVVGCSRNIARDQAVAQADAARARGDVAGEALALRDACRAAPDDKKLCKRADGAWGAAQAAAQQAAATACGSGVGAVAVDRCLGAVAQLRRLRPDDPEAARLAEAAGRQHAAHCVTEAPRWETSIDDALELVRCEDGRADQIAVPSYLQKLAEDRAVARDQLVHMLDKPELAGHAGASSEVLAAAVCLSATPGLVEQARAARAAFVDRSRASIDLRVTTAQPLPGLCPTTASLLGERVVCGSPRASAPQITVVGEVDLPPVEHSAFETPESVEYVAGIQRVPNPEYRTASERERYAREAKDQAERDYRRDQSDCSSAESRWHSASSCSSCSEKTERDRVCNEAQSSERLYHDRNSDWEQANRALSNTPSIIEHKDIRTAHYMVRHHTWRAVWRAQLRSDGKTMGAGGDTAAEDIETSGAPVAGVAADPLTYPGDRWYVAPLRDQVATKLAEIVVSALQRRAGDLALKCESGVTWTGDWLDCFARVKLWSGAQPDPGTLVHTAGAEHDRAHGAAWPPLRCAGGH